MRFAQTGHATDNIAGITLCITMGRRPDLLRKTLLSLGDMLESMPILAINDFGDAETNNTFADICPLGKRVDNVRQVGHHPAIDAMYECVSTPYVFHCEDDWLFDSSAFLDAALRLLEEDPLIVSVCLRKLSDIPLTTNEIFKVRHVTQAGIAYHRLDKVHDQWHAFTFNPHLIRTQLWAELGGYSRFKRERHISRYLLGQGRFVAYLDPGACHHIGENASVSAPKKLLVRRFKRWLRGQNYG